MKRFYLTTEHVKKKKENLHRFALNEMAIGKGFPPFFSQNLDS